MPPLRPRPAARGAVLQPAAALGEVPAHVPEPPQKRGAVEGIAADEERKQGAQLPDGAARKALRATPSLVGWRSRPADAHLAAT